MKMIAIIGATASGKSDLALEFAQKINGCILSLDSLSIYKHINIVSAKPSKSDLDKVKHFGIDIKNPDNSFSIMDFIEVFEYAYKEACANKMPLIISGGSSFYLKTLIEGISPLPILDDKIREKAKEKAKNLEKAYEFLYKLDKKYMVNIKPNDRYRVTRAFEIYLSTREPMSEFFEKNPRKKILNIVDNIDVFNLDIQKDTLHKRIKMRVINMIDNGLINEVQFLRDNYGDTLVSKKSIGIKETLEFLENKIDKDELIEQISTNTRKLAKRQKTFNRHQFTNIINGEYIEIFDYIIKNKNQYML
jgi:tRNA dimethylallyltransferase